MEQWYTLYTKPRAEYQVKQVLEARNIETYLPTVKVWRARRRRLEEEPFFSCYFFARFNLNETGLSAIAWTPGLRHIVGGKADQPTPVPNDVIAYIRHRVSGLNPQRAGANFKPGDPVHITEGPFKELDAVFNQHLSSHDRGQVLVKILGRLTRYDVPLEWLKPT